MLALAAACASATLSPELLVWPESCKTAHQKRPQDLAKVMLLHPTCLFGMTCLQRTVGPTWQTTSADGAACRSARPVCSRWLGLPDAHLLAAKGQELLLQELLQETHMAECHQTQVHHTQEVHRPATDNSLFRPQISLNLQGQALEV